jgi:DNA-binding GntR family transcriptional regulator
VARTIEVEKGDTLANVLRRHISDSILQNEIAPGTRLDEQRLAAQFGVSRTPVREALTQLSAAGLVTTRPHAGSIVRPIEQARVSSLCEAAIELESLCARLAASKMSVMELGRLKSWHEACAAADSSDDVDRYAQSNRNFHSTIITGTHNSDLADCVEMCRLRIAPYQRLPFALEERRAAVQAEHAAILRALERRSPEEAEAAMREHLSVAAIAIDQQLRLAGWY